jgi:serine-type D-Ala-D-Ala carboxypeptidase/endopeptidase (penicillin-binding protein 4)
MRSVQLTCLSFALLLLAGCSANRVITRQLRQAADSLQTHTGFVLYDPTQKKNLVNINGNKYFTPASNTKIFTLFAGLSLLGDSVSALRWISKNDSLIFWGTGDPSLLYSEVYQNNRTINFLQSRSEKLFFSSSNFQDDAYGPGWSWADYQDYYQVERNSLPLYGNLVSVNASQGVQPKAFRKLTTSTTKGELLSRDRYSNSISLNNSKIKQQTEVIPFITHDTLTVQLLRDTLQRDVKHISYPLPKTANTLFSIKADSLYKVMMQASDNFIAEQILLMCAQSLADTLKSDITIEHVIRHRFAKAPDPLLWFDGSGLSRYNQFTPRTIIALWEKLYAMVPQNRLFSLLVTNGKPGTLSSLLPGMPTFIYGKTGSLANNYCLSGYIVTRKKRLLIFSSMNSGITTGTSAVRNKLSQTLQYIYEHY